MLCYVKQTVTLILENNVILSVNFRTQNRKIITAKTVTTKLDLSDDHEKNSIFIPQIEKRKKKKKTHFQEIQEKGKKSEETHKQTQTQLKSERKMSKKKE